MKRLLLTIAFAIAVFTPRPAAAQYPVLATYFCVGSTYEVDENFSCYESMGPSYIVYAQEEVVGYCSNNGAPLAAQGVFGACGSGFQPIASATGFVNWGIPWIIPGRVIAYAHLTNYPGNPEATTTTDCYGYTSSSIEPILPC